MDRNKRHGWLCLLRAGHPGEHYSVDNRRKQEGKPGHAVRWDQAPSYGDAVVAAIQQRADGVLPLHTADSVAPVHPLQGVRVAHVVQRPKPPASRHQARPGYTGILCDNCGSPNTVRIGKCLRCDDCMSAGECG